MTKYDFCKSPIKKSTEIEQISDPCSLKRIRNIDKKQSFLAGIAVFATGSVFSSQVMKRIEEARKNESKLGEERINITNESITNMKTLKFYQLTDIFKS